MSDLYQWRAWIGPRWREPDNALDPAAYLNIVSGAIPLAECATSLSSGIAYDANSLNVFSGTGYPLTNGWAFIGANAPIGSAACEYVEYATRSGNTLGALVREPAGLREHDGSHALGSPVRLFWPLNTNDGKLILSEQLDQKMASINWSAKISGVLIPQVALRNEHLIAIETRTNGGSWELMLLGWIDTPAIRDDYQRRGEWQIQILSTGAAFGRRKIGGIRAGGVNFAANSSVSADTTLSDYRTEAASGDFSGIPTFEASNTTDGKAATLWISDRVLGHVIAGAGLGMSTFASEIYINRWPGDTSPSRYIEWYCDEGEKMNVRICSSTGAEANVKWGHVYTAAGDRIILAEDKVTFNNNHPLSKAKAVISIGSDFFNALNPASDAIAVYQGLVGLWSNVVAWGSATRAHRADDGTSGSESWPGTQCTAPTAGQVIRFQNVASPTNRVDMFKTDYLAHAGYIPPNPPSWLIFQLPKLGLQIRDNWTNSNPGAGDDAQLTNGSTSSTAGLPSSGTIQIGLEQISYSSKTANTIHISGRGANSTTAASHAAGDPIKFVVSGNAFEGVPVRRLEWSRRSGGIVPAEFTVRGSTLDSPRDPSADHYTDDWTTITTVTGHSAATWGYDLTPPARYAAIMIEIEHMDTDPARARINDVKIVGDETQYGGQLAVTTPCHPGVIIEQALIAAGIPDAAISWTGTARIGDTSTARDTALNVAVDMADYGGALIDNYRNGLITITDNPFWSAGSFTPAATWTRDNAARVEIVQKPEPAIVQVSLKWQTADGTNEGTIYYPDKPPANAEATPIDLLIYPDATAAGNAAKRKFIMSRYPFTLVIQPSTADPTLRPGAVHRLQWQIDASMQPIDRYLLIVACDHQVDRGSWTTVLSGIQIDREAGY